MMTCVSEQQRGQAEDEEIDMGNNADNTGMLWPANGYCGLLMVIGRFVKMSQVAEDNLLLGLIITIWLVPGILTMRDYLRGRKE